MRQRIILYVVRACSGGMLAHLLYLLQYLDRSSFRPLVAGPPSHRLAATVAALDVDYLPLARQGACCSWWYIRARAELAELIRSSRVELVHTHGVQAGLAGRWAAHRAGVPVVATAHNFIYSRPGAAWQKPILAAYQRRLTPVTGRYIAVCSGLAQELQLVEKVPAEKIVVIHNGVDLERLAATFRRVGESGSLLPPGPLVGIVARLIHEKGVDIFLRACAEVGRQEREAKFVIIGDGPERLPLERQAYHLGIRDRVLFLGEVKEAAAYLPLLDVYVQSSRQEGCSVAVVEAMAAGRPVVASKTGGLPDIVQPGENGFLVGCGDWREMAAKILLLLCDQGMAGHLGRQGRRLVVEKFEARQMAEDTQAVYHGLL